jgi:hypothetical protein
MKIRKVLILKEAAVDLEEGRLFYDSTVGCNKQSALHRMYGSDLMWQSRKSFHSPINA